MKNCVKRGHRVVDCWKNKGKEKDYDVEKLFVEATFCEKVSEDDKEEDPEEWLGDNGASSHITHKKKEVIGVENAILM